MIPHQPPWMDIVWDQLGVQEHLGAGKSNPVIDKYHRSVADDGTPDDVAWCSSTANYIMETAGFKGTDSRAGISWEKWGVGLGIPAYGCLITLWYTTPSDWRRHVGFFLGFVGDDVIVAGGNQSNEFRISRYPQARVMSHRWPDKGTING